MSTDPVRIKICGLTRVEDALLAVELGADYLGLNFSARSPRRLSVAAAREIATAVAGRAALVGVFVDQPAEEIAAIDRAVGLDRIQLSGDEEPSALAPFPGRAIRTFRTGGDPGAAALAAASAAWALLIDAPHGTLFGGTGRAWSYAGIAPLARRHRVFLAGGLNPDNVRAAIAACQPFAVDVCSRIESSPGVKSPELLQRFVSEVKDGQTPTPP